MNIIKMIFKPIFDEGFAAGVNAEKLVKENDAAEREYKALQLGKTLGRLELLDEMESEIEEISAEEFDRIAATIEEPKPFGFVGNMENMQLVLEGDA